MRSLVIWQDFAIIGYMQAAILEDYEKLVVKDVPEPECGDNQAILKVKSCAVCGSDIRIYHFGNDRVNLPAVMGHEIAGEIFRVGRNVEHLEPGDRVALGADVPCGECYWCTNGMGTNCKINYAIGYQFAGGFQEYMLLNETVLKYGPVAKIPASLGFDEAAIAEPLGCALHGLELSQFSPGKSLCIIGLGPLGCMMLELSKLYGASKVFAAQRSKKRLAMAGPFREDARFIATQDEDLVETVMRETGGEGVDLVITTAGTVQAHKDAVAMVRHRGFVNLFGGLKNQPELKLDSNLIHYKECFVMGSHGSLPRHHAMAIDLIDRGFVSAARYISKTFALAQTRSAFEYHESRQGLKVVVRPEQ